MEGSIATGRSGSPVSGYSRAELDEFLAEASSERVRLEAAIAAEAERTRRARSALGTHRVMVAMLLSAQRELDDIRARAEREAALILAGPERTVPVLDLTRSERSESSDRSGQAAAVSSPNPITEPSVVAPASPEVAAPVAPDDESNDYFDFLRGALDDDAPLGPRPEPT
jgi:hypothetical protein